MGQTPKPPISSREDLLAAMRKPEFDEHRVIGTILKCDGDSPCVETHFDMGGGHSGNFPVESRPVEKSVALQAIKMRDVRGAHRTGYTSTSEFVISDEGQAEYVRNRRLARGILECFPPSGALRVNDFERILAWLVSTGHLQMDVQADGVHYSRFSPRG